MENTSTRQTMPQNTALAMSASQVAELFGWSVKTLQNRINGLGLPYVRFGKRGMVFMPADVEAFLLKHRVANDPPVVELVKRGRGRPKGSCTRRPAHGEG